MCPGLTDDQSEFLRSARNSVADLAGPIAKRAGLDVSEHSGVAFVTGVVSGKETSKAFFAQVITGGIVFAQTLGLEGESAPG